MALGRQSGPWNVAIDKLLVILNNAGYYTQGFADDIAIFIMGKGVTTI